MPNKKAQAAIEEFDATHPGTVDPEPAPGLVHYAITPDTERAIEHRFTYRSPKGDQPDRYNAIRGMAFNMARELAAFCPASYELDIAVTKLEEMVMWANASIARNEA